MNKTKNKKIISQSKITKSLAGLVVTMMILYLYCVNITSFNAASYEEMAVVIDQANSEISELESSLNQLKRKITRDMAEEYDLVAIQEKNLTFALRDNSTRLTINE